MEQSLDLKIYNDEVFGSITGRNRLTIPNVILLSTPIAPAGSIVYDTATDLVYFSDGLVWTAIGTGGGGVASVNSGTGITVDNTDPANPIINMSNVGPGAGTTVSPSSITINDRGQITAIVGGGGGAVTGTGTTAPGGTTTMTNPIAIAMDSVCIVRTTVIGRNLVTGEANAFIVTNAVKDVGGASSKLSTFDDVTPFQENGDTDAAITVVGNDIVIEVTGTAGAGMDWTSSTEVLCEM